MGHMRQGFLEEKLLLRRGLQLVALDLVLDELGVTFLPVQDDFSVLIDIQLLCQVILFTDLRKRLWNLLLLPQIN